MPTPTRKFRSAVLFGGAVATWVNASEPADSACAMQLPPWVGLKSAALLMSTPALHSRASTPKICEATAFGGDWAST